MKTESSTKFAGLDRFFNYLQGLRQSDRLLIKLLLLVFFVSGIYNLYLLNQHFTVTEPADGGVLVEGVIGTPRFINPVLAITRADHDLVALTYSGLLKLSPSGELVNDLADSLTISDDGLVYNIVLKQNKTFHDGTPITANDVAYTIALVQNADLKSPERGNWVGIKVEVVNEYELNLVLDKAYSPFEENLTLGILPKHIWDNLSIEELPFSQYNTEPVGSGPYELDTIKRDESGLISEYQLSASREDATVTNIDKIIIRFYQNEDDVLKAMTAGEINATASLSEKGLTKFNTNGWQFVTEPLPRIFAIFFNQNKSASLRDKSAREALSVSINRDDLVDRALNGFGEKINSALPNGFVDTDEATTTDGNLEEAKQILFDGGWVKTDDGHWEKEIDGTNTRLAISLRSSNTRVFEETTAYLVEVWRELGVEVNVELYNQSDLVQTVIRPRDYQALLFGIDIGRQLDLYSFWHSSEREDPGLNVSLYANITADRLLEKLRTEQDETKKIEYINALLTEIAADNPAIFLYSPHFVYVTKDNIHPSDMDHLAEASERFSNVKNWYMKETAVWPVFK